MLCPAQRSGLRTIRDEGGGNEGGGLASGLAPSGFDGFDCFGGGESGAFKSAASVDRTHDLRIMRPTRYRLRNSRGVLRSACWMTPMESIRRCQCILTRVDHFTDQLVRACHVPSQRSGLRTIMD